MREQLWRHRRKPQPNCRNCRKTSKKNARYYSQDYWYSLNLFISFFFVHHFLFSWPSLISVFLSIFFLLSFRHYLFSHHFPHFVKTKRFFLFCFLNVVVNTQFEHSCDYFQNIVFKINEAIFVYSKQFVGAMAKVDCFTKNWTVLVQSFVEYKTSLIKK